MLFNQKLVKINSTKLPLLTEKVLLYFLNKAAFFIEFNRKCFSKRGLSGEARLFPIRVSKVKTNIAVEAGRPPLGEKVVSTFRPYLLFMTHYISEVKGLRNSYSLPFRGKVASINDTLNLVRVS